MITRGMRLVVAVVSALLVPANVLAGTGDVVAVSPTSDGLAVHIGKRLVLKYRHKGVPAKPYVQQLFTPGGTNVLRDAPHDHLHHHALMFALAIDGIGFWAEGEKDGREIHQDVRVVGGQANGGFTERLAWQARDGKTLLNEERTILVHEDQLFEQLGATLLTWTSRLSAAGGVDRTLSGAHYYGLGMRFLVSMDKGGKFMNSAGIEGRIFRGAERLLCANWCAYMAEADGKPVTAVMFDHPDNVRHPATWFTMPRPFAYLAATLNLHAEPLTLKADEPMSLCYGVAVCDGHVTVSDLEKLYQLWIKKVALSKKSIKKN